MNITPFFVVATDLTHLKLTAGVDEAEIGKVRPNMDVTFRSIRIRRRCSTARSTPSGSTRQTQNNVVTYPVWIDVPNPDLKLRPSMTAQVKVIMHTVPNVVRVPNQGCASGRTRRSTRRSGFRRRRRARVAAAAARTRRTGDANGQGAGAQGATPPAPGAAGGAAGAPNDDPAPPPPGASAQPRTARTAQRSARPDGAEQPGQRPGRQSGSTAGGNRNRNGRGGSGAGSASAMASAKRQHRT